jgi:hypothetical protein
MSKINGKIFSALAISLLIIIIITFLTVDASTWTAFKEINIFYLYLIIAVTFLAWLLNGIKLKVLSSGVGVKIKFFHAVELGLVDRFFSNITPSGIGGQPIKTAAMMKFDISSGKAGAVVVVELLLRLFFFAFSLPLVIYKISDIFFDYVRPIFLSIGTAIFISTLIILIYLMLYKVKLFLKLSFSLLNIKLSRKLIGEEKIYSWKRKLAEEIKIFNSTIWTYIKSGLFELFIAFLLTVLLWMLRFTILYFIIKGFNLEIELGFIILVQLLIYTTVLFIPVPGGSGIEVLLAVILNRFFPLSLVGIIAALWRFFTYYSYIFIGSFVSFKIFKLQEDVENIEMNRS